MTAGKTEIWFRTQGRFAVAIVGSDEDREKLLRDDDPDPTLLTVRIGAIRDPQFEQDIAAAIRGYIDRTMGGKGQWVFEPAKKSS
jgi:hypothetical protein